MAAVPTVEQAQAYLTQQGVSRPTEQVTAALAAETSAQAAACRVANYTPDLAQALLRRVHRNLAMRALPLGLQQDESGAVRLGSTDPEVRRLEGPYRKKRAR